LHPGPTSRRRAISLAAAIAVAGTAACGGEEPDFYVHRTAVYVDSDAPFVRRPDFPERLEVVLAVALRYWGGDWRSLAGRSITFSGDPSVVCGGAPRALGCYDGDVWVSTSDPGVGTVACVERTVLVHEVGHAVIGDPMHRDPRWMRLDPVGEALAGAAGYAAGGEVACEIALSVWRHPLNQP
jgi:hypothetical protein